MKEFSDVRSAKELELKYDFNSITINKEELQLHKRELVKTNAEIELTKTAILTVIIDLGENDINIWFGNGYPVVAMIITEDNNIIITEDNNNVVTENSGNFENGDLYYDKLNARVYQNINGVWNEKTDKSLISALALTEAGLQENVSSRKIFFNTPIPPYTSGDWHIGTEDILYICQIGKSIGEQYSVDDFILSNKYVQTVASKTGNETKVLKGQVVYITENYASFEDLRTGGRTEIAGENITTGTLKSQNYIECISGSKIDLINGKIDTPKVKLSQDGLTLLDGTKLIMEDGMKTVLTYESDWQEIGWVNFGGTYSQMSAFLNAYIPNNFVIIKALLITDIGCRFVYGSQYITEGFYAPKNVKLKTSNGITNTYIDYPVDSTQTISSSGGTINSDFGIWQLQNSNEVQTKTIDVTNIVKSNVRTQFTVYGGNDMPQSYIDGGIAKMFLVVEGYSKNI